MRITRFFFICLESSFLTYKKRSARDAHCGVQGRCRKRPPQAQECAEAHSLFLSNPAKCDSKNQYDKADWYIDVFADRNEVFGEFPFPAFIDLFFDVAFLTYPKEHDSGESRAQWTNVYRKNIHPCGDDALNQK